MGTKTLSRESGNVTAKDLHWKVLSDITTGLLGFITQEEHDTMLGIVRSRDVLRYAAYCEILSNQMYAEDVTADRFRALSQLVCFLKKFPFSTGCSDKDRKLSAVAKFYDGERACKATNKRFRHYFTKGNGLRLERQRPGLTCVLDYARKLVEKMIGSEPSMGQIFSHSRHGPGGSLCTDNSAGKVTAYYKYATRPYTCTRLAEPYVATMIMSDHRWMRLLRADYPGETPAVIGDADLDREIIRSHLRYVDTSKITFVPKDMKTFRPIAIEPRLNLFLQLGVDGVIRKALKRVGQDLNDSTRNSEAARVGSINGSLATIDLSNASDTVSMEIVRFLLPPEWFTFLYCIRTGKGTFDGNEISLEKFSSMGNGFTFALESLIFYVLAEAVAWEQSMTRQNINVYGDDIIIPTNMALRLVEVLKFCGFTVNTTKSFFFGGFRESCGSDYLRGVDVRPLYLKKELSHVTDLYWLCNGLRSYSRRFNSPYCVYEKAATRVFGSIPPELRFTGPISYSRESDKIDLVNSYVMAVTPPLRVVRDDNLSIVRKEIQFRPTVYRGQRDWVYLAHLGQGISDRITRRSRGEWNVVDIVTPNWGQDVRKSLALFPWARVFDF